MLAMKLSKTELRAKLKSQRQNLAEADVKAWSEKIIGRCIKLIPWTEIKTLHTYVPVLKENEVDSWHLLEYAWQMHPKIKTAVPVLSSSGKYDSVLVAPSTKWQRQGLRIPEPIDGEVLPDGEQFDVVIVPMLGFDKAGHRLGHGKGWYDRFLATQPRALTIGLCYEFGLIKQGLPHEPHDVAVRHIVTEKIARKTATA